MKAKELLKDKGELSHKTRTIKDLIRFINTRENEDTSNYSLLLGAGASRSSGIATASELIDKWKAELYVRFESSSFVPGNEFESLDEYFEKKHASWYNSLSSYSSLFEKQFDLPAQRRRFVENEVSGKFPSIGYAYLISLVEKNFFNTIFTTNFDDLLNESFYQLSTTRPIICAHDSSVHSISITSKRPKILKLHGDYLFEDIKSTLRETESLEQNIKDKLIEFCKEFGLIVIGYSGSDRSVMDVMDYLVKRDNYLKNGLYWCFREEDDINQNVKNLLWKDRVYPVLITGFDELFAEFYHSLNGQFGQLFKKNKETIQDKIVMNIIDRFSKSDNAIIKKEIEEMSRSRDMIDISNFMNISEYSNKKERVNLKNFRNLLEVSELSKSNPIDAYKKCVSYLKNLSYFDDKEKFLKKLIELSLLLNNRDDAVSWANKLIELDKYDSDNQLIRIDCIEDVVEQESEITKLENELSHSYIIYNKHIRILFKLLDNEEGDCEKVKRLSDKIDSCIKKSISLNRSLSNYVFQHKHKFLSYKLDNISIFNNKSSELDEIKRKLENDILELLDEVKNTNKYHPAYALLLHAESNRINEREYYHYAVNECYEVRKNQRIDLVKDTNDIINRILISSLDARDSDGYCNLHEDFYSQIDIEDYINYSCHCLLSKALFLFFVKQDKTEAVKFIRKALQDDDINDELVYTLTVSSIVDKEILHDIEKHIENIKPIIKERYYWYLQVNLHGEYDDYEKHLECLDKLYEIENDFEYYMNTKSFALLKLKRYNELISLFNENSNKIKGKKFDVFRINVLIAKSKLNYENINSEIREMLATVKDVLQNIVLTILSQSNTHQAYDRLNKLINNNPMLYYNVREWVVIDPNQLKRKLI
ncbi:TPA: SIR2 family protein [Pasteurella multocida]